jgi:hypothetical protein
MYIFVSDGKKINKRKTGVASDWLDWKANQMPPFMPSPYGVISNQVWPE